MEKEAYLYEKLEDSKVRCHLCNHQCIIAPQKRGLCGVRENRDGALYSLVYNHVVSINRDPIEKKPLYHFYPGSASLSIATVGCNFTCLHCQNNEISQFPKLHKTEELPGIPITPKEIVEKALKTQSKSISYTYTEPTVYYELVYDTAELAAKNGIKNCFVTNGYMTEEALYQLSPFIDAANIDLKSFQDDFYRNICGARLEPVLKTIKKMHELGIWIEITTLIIPEENESPDELKKIADFIFRISPEIPWHVSAFYPHFHMEDKLPTSPDKISEARGIGKKMGLKYIYSGNVRCDPGAHTYCPECNETLIERHGFRVTRFDINHGRCPSCGQAIDGVFE